MCVGNLTIICSDNGFSPGRRQAIIRTNTGLLLTVPLGPNFGEILIEIHTFSFKKMHLNMSSGKWRLFCLALTDFSSPRCDSTSVDLSWRHSHLHSRPKRQGCLARSGCYGQRRVARSTENWHVNSCRVGHRTSSCDVYSTW